MKTICPCCQSTAVYEMTDGISNNLIDQLLSPTVLVSLGVSLCKTLRVHPAIGVVVGTTVAALIEMTQSHQAPPMLVNQQYRCDECFHVFTSLH
ncbi:MULTISPECIES: hypothetical protein [unclassified Psychrobacter]|uniref:hypothetical protein n=1 Tax=unclassified Psychrobacter TaxID=196806 RepID=UPI002609F964|nr:hypothetical protein [uncultured Psychrobacter sp.]